jgi:hypothetical protein
MLDSREKERERRIVLLHFGFNGEERKKNVFCIISSKRKIVSCLLIKEEEEYNLMKTRSQSVHLPVFDVENEDNEKNNIGPS